MRGGFRREASRLVSQLSDEFMVYLLAAPSNSDAIEGSFLIEKKRMMMFSFTATLKLVTTVVIKSHSQQGNNSAVYHQLPKMYFHR